ncbi:MAG: six-cysteine ranthipeptide SCIFF [Bacillota bacterium]
MKKTHVKTVLKAPIKHIQVDERCAACQSSCQSACKTSCTVGNQVCPR